MPKEKKVNLKVYSVFPVCGLVLSCIKWSSRGKYKKVQKTPLPPLVWCARRSWGSAGKERGDSALGAGFCSGWSARDSGEERGWAWREGPQVHSLSAMQMKCKSARVSRRLQFESGPDPKRRALSRGPSRAFVPDSPTCSLARRAAHRRPTAPGPGRASPVSRTARSAAGGGASPEPALRALGRGAPSERGASAPGPPSPRG